VRAAQIALAVMCIQIGMGFIVVSGLFGDLYYENKITDVKITRNTTSYTSDIERAGTISDPINWIRNVLMWGWIKQYVLPWYNNDVGFKAFIDYLIAILNSVAFFIYLLALLEIYANRVDTLGG